MDAATWWPPIVGPVYYLTGIDQAKDLQSAIRISEIKKVLSFGVPPDFDAVVRSPDYVNSIIVQGLMLAQVNSEYVVYFAFVIGVPASRNVEPFFIQLRDGIRPDSR